MDRPEREKIIGILSSGMLRSGDALNGKGELVEKDSYLFITKEYKGRIADQIQALIPDVEEAKRQEGERIIKYLKARWTYTEVVRTGDIHVVFHLPEKWEQTLKEMPDSFEKEGR